MAIEAITITACGNSTPPAGTCVAGFKTSACFFIQGVVPTDTNGNQFGIGGGSPLHASITNSPSVVVNSGSMVVTNQVSASISAGSVALLAGANTIGSASAIQSGAWGVSASVVNSPSVVVTNGLSASISNPVTVVQGASGASPWGVRILDAAGLAYGVSAGSPLHAAASAVITNSPSVFVTSATASPIFTRLSDGTDTVAVDAASRLLVTASFTDGLTVTSASVTVVNNGTASPIFTRLTDGTDTVAVDAASRLLVTASFTDGLTVTSASVTIVNNSAGACVLYTSACITNLAGSAAGSPLFTTASVTNIVTVIPGASGASPWGVKILDSDGLAYGTAVASPLFAKLSDGVDSVTVDAASRLLTAACVVNTVTVAQGASGASPWGVRILDAAGLAYGVAAASPIFVAASSVITNSPSVTVNSLAGSAAGSPLFTSVTNLAGSAAGSPLFNSITNLAGSAAGSPLFARLSDGTDTAAIDSASRLGIALTDGTNAYGLPASPLSQVGQGQTIAWAGSLLTIQQIDLSSSISGCTAIVASSAGNATIILNATFTTSSCQRIGWTACGNNGGASAAIQTPMPFGTNGGMDAKRSPDSYLWAFPSGSIAVLTTTSASYVAGTINYVRVAS